jgi:hypothetical protein
MRAKKSSPRKLPATIILDQRYSGLNKRCRGAGEDSARLFLLPLFDRFPGMNE